MFFGSLLFIVASQAEGAPAWPIRSVDRAADGTLFGVSQRALYRSRDGAASWERLAEGENLGEVYVAADGGHALVIAHRGARLWEGAETLWPVPLARAEPWIVTVWARAGKLWLASALEDPEDEETRDLLYTRDAPMISPGLHTLVLASLDEGRSWREIAAHGGALVRAGELGADGVLRLCFSDGTLRGGGIDANDGELVDGALQLLSAPLQHLGSDEASWLLFPDARTGWVGGQRFFGGADVARTSDGGRTWTELDAPADEWIEAFRLGGGACVRVAGLWHPGARVELWRAGEFHELRRFEGEVHDARADAGGGLLVRSKDGEVWRLSADGGAWQRIGTIPVPK